MVGNFLGCDMAGLKKCLEKKNVTEIVAAQENITSDVTKGRIFLPVIDNYFLNGKCAIV